MPKDKADVLEVLKTELNFLEMGGYSLGRWVSEIELQRKLDETRIVRSLSEAKGTI